MKTGVIVDCFRLGAAEGINAAGRLGFDGVQIYATHGEFSHEGLTPEKKQYFKDLLAKNNLKVSALCGDFGGYGFAKPNENPERIEKTKRIIDLAPEFGTNIVTTHVGTIPADQSDPVYKAMLDAITECGKYAKERGISLAIETGPESAEILLAFIESTEGGVGVNLDPANFVMTLGIDPVETVYVLKDHILHTHVKDGRHIPKGEMRVGEGEVDFDRYFKALKEIGYNGYLTIEREAGTDRYGDIEKAKAFILSKF